MFARILDLVVRFLAPLLGYVAASLLFILMIFTCADVFGRYFFNRPMVGGFELTQISLAVLIFAGLPLITLRNENITVDLFDAIIPAGLRRFQYATVQLIGAVICGLLTRQLWARGDQLKLMQDTTVDYQIPLSYVAYTMSILMGVTAMVFLLMALSPPQPSPQTPEIE